MSHQLIRAEQSSEPEHANWRVPGYGGRAAMGKQSVMPSPWEAPLSLLGLAGNCGPMSVWLVLRLFRKRVGAARIIRACRHSERTGCFGIALALALHQFGLRVSFHTDPDPAVQPLDARCYEWAQRRGIPVAPAVGLGELRRLIRYRPAIVSLAGTDGSGHFSPLLGFRRGKALLPYTDGKRLAVEDFERRWCGPGYPRQCMLVSAEPAAAADRGRRTVLRSSR